MNVAPSCAVGGSAAVGRCPDGRDFISMLEAYRSSGGTAPGDVLGQLLKNHRHGGCISLAGLIADGDVFAFAWRGNSWIPMFQFEVRDLSVLPGPRLARVELGASSSGWAVATWFAMPNALLDGRRPVDVVGTDLSAVVAAARCAGQAEKPIPVIEASSRVRRWIAQEEGAGHRWRAQVDGWPAQTGPRGVVNPARSPEVKLALHSTAK